MKKKLNDSEDMRLAPETGVILPKEDMTLKLRKRYVNKVGKFFRLSSRK